MRSPPYCLIIHRKQQVVCLLNTDWLILLYCRPQNFVLKKSQTFLRNTLNSIFSAWKPQKMWCRHCLFPLTSKICDLPFFKKFWNYSNIQKNWQREKDHLQHRRFEKVLIYPNRKFLISAHMKNEKMCFFLFWSFQRKWLV